MQKTDRLTYKTQGDATRGSHYCTGLGIRKDDVVQRLGEYEDTGLSPEEIVPVKHGYWAAENNRPKSVMYRCSVCGEIAHDRPLGSARHYVKKKCTLEYCPHCGAKMD